MIAPVLQEADRSRWMDFVSMTPPDEIRFIRAKWHLPANFGGGDPPRPRSAAEMATILRVEPDEVRKQDWRIVAICRGLRRRDYRFWSFLRVPIDAGQEWWDKKHSWLLNPDGSRKPEHQVGHPPPESPPLELHEVGEEQVPQHILEVHHVDATEGLRAWRIWHMQLHEDETQDKEWDRLYRSAYL